MAQGTKTNPGYSTVFVAGYCQSFAVANIAGITTKNKRITAHRSQKKKKIDSGTDIAPGYSTVFVTICCQRLVVAYSAGLAVPKEKNFQNKVQKKNKYK